MNDDEAADESAVKRSGRVDAIDLSRGLAIVGMAGYHLTWDLANFHLVSPGLPYSSRPDKDGRLFADEGHLRQIDPIHYHNGLVSDAQGRLVLPALIPGATYRFIDDTTFFDPAGPQVRKEFTVQPGETLDLGEIHIEKPQGLSR